MATTDTQRAYELLRAKIITTQMPPGAVIQEGELIAELGLGRTPIREALKLLETQRLVHVSPRRGMFVTPINMADLVEIQEIRQVLDPLCIRLAARRITTDELAALQEIVDQAGPVEARGDVEALLSLDQRFHRSLAEATRNQLLQSELELLYDLSLRIWHFYRDRVAAEDLAFDALANLVVALAQKDVRRAEQAMLKHILHYGEALRRCL